MTADLKAKQAKCAGCRDDFYNHGGHAMNGEHCWMLPEAKEVTRYRLDWWTSPAAPRAYTEVRVFDCYHQPGQFAYHKELPDFAVEPQLLEQARG